LSPTEGLDVSHQIFLVSLHAATQDDDGVREEIAELLHRVGGFVLMATGASALITAFDEQWLSLFKRHPAVEFCGALQLDPNGAAADKLRHLFAANVAAQLASRADVPAEVPTGPRHRPLVWHRPVQQPPGHSTGISISTQPTARGLP
jgi:hypothetical protein